MSRYTLLGMMAGVCLALTFSSVRGDDWPMSRHDAQRSACTPQPLAEQLYLQWVRDYPRLQTAWPDQPKMVFDRAYDPVVLGTTLFVGSSRTDSLTALDTRTGAMKWEYFVDGPVRFAPVAWEGKVYCVSDDGYLYCLDGVNGKLLWKFRGGPSDRKILGNGRLISTWPARGGPVLADGTVYFAAGIWPFMGIFLHALDARTGQVVWSNDGDGSLYMKQPHNADAFGGVAPQGALVVAGDRLLVPGGRSVPACYDRKTGRLLYYHLADNGKRGGGADVACQDNVWFNGGAAFELTTGAYLGNAPRPLTLGGDVVGLHAGKYTAFNLAKAGVAVAEEPDRKGTPVKKARWKIVDARNNKAPALECLIQAGSRLYAGSPRRVEAVELPLVNNEDAKVSWQADLEGTPATLLAADARLFVVTLEGRIYCFGPERLEPKTYPIEPTPTPADNDWTARARGILDAGGARDGYGVAWGVGTGRLVHELLRHSKLHIVVVDPEPARVASFRKEMIAAGLYGARVAVHAGDPRTFALPPYLAGLMVAEEPRLLLEADRLHKAFAALRPYGGAVCLTLTAEQRKEFARLADVIASPQAKMRETGAYTLLTRDGALPGSADWTHEHADAANTRVSRDRLVQLPLGILWFGGSSHHGILPRHGHGPQPQVIDGRVIVEGVDLLRALDIYTGRVLWETSLPGVGKIYNNLAHQPGANATGTNFISTHDGIYVLHQNACVRLDPASGVKNAEFKIPDAPAWTYLNVADDYLVGGYNPAPADVADPKQFPQRLQTWNLGTQQPTASLTGHTDDVLALAVSADGTRLASAGDDKTVRLWDAATHKLLATLKKHTEPITCLAFSPDGKTLASGGKDRLIFLWDAATGELKTTLTGHKENLAALVFADDGKTLVSADAEAHVRIWNVAGGQAQAVIEGNIEDVTALTFTPDARVLAAGTAEGNVKLVDLDSREVRTLEGHKGQILALACAPDGKTLAAGNKDRSVKLYDFATGKIRILKEPISTITSVRFAPDGKTLAVATDEGNVHVWNLGTRKIDFVLKGSAGAVKSLAFAAGSLLTGAADKQAKPNPAQRSSTRHLVVMERHSGKVLWTLEARESFRNNAVCIGGGKLFCIDRAAPEELARLKRRGLTPKNKPCVRTLDLATGRELWASEADVFGTWLSYSARHDLLVEAGRKARDTLLDEPKGMRAFAAGSGKVLWHNPDLLGPAMLHGDFILHDTGACEILTGTPKMRDDPVTGQRVPWKWARSYGCNTPLAAEHLMTFRSGAAGFCDLAHDAGTGNFGGFRSSCSNNLIVADGLLTVPDYTRTCTCSYQNQTSLALVPMPEVELWTKLPRDSASLLSLVKPAAPWDKKPKPIKHLALNLGAPGQHRAADGRLWLNDYEHARITFDRFGYYNRHSSTIVAAAASHPWVVCSGCRGLNRLEIALKPLKKTGDRYTIRLHFADPDNDKPGQRTFDVTLQDKPALKSLDVVQESGGRFQGLVKEFQGVLVTDRLVVAFTGVGDLQANVPFLCGLEMVREEE